MSNTISVSTLDGVESRIINAHEDAENKYRLDVGGVKILFDSVTVSGSNKTFTMSRDGKTCASVDADIIPDKIEGALSVLSQNS